MHNTQLFIAIQIRDKKNLDLNFNLIFFSAQVNLPTVVEFIEKACLMLFLIL